MSEHLTYFEASHSPLSYTKQDWPAREITSPIYRIG